MKKIVLIFLLPFFIVHIAYSGAVQQNSIDSLLNVIKTSIDTNKINSLNELSWLYINVGKYEMALKYAEQSLGHSQSLGYLKGVAFSYNTIGVTYWYQSNYEKAVENYFKSLKIRENIGDKKGTASSYSNIGIVFENQGNYEKALNYHLKALKIQEETGDEELIPNSYNNIGGIYLALGNYEKAKNYYLKCLKIYEDNGYKTGIAISFNNLGIIYQKQGNSGKALESYLKSLKISEEINHNALKKSALGNIGVIYTSKGNYVKAMNNFMDCLKISKEMGDKHGIGLAYINIGIIYSKQGYFSEAFEYLNKSLVLSKEIGYKKDIKEAYSALSELYVKRGDYKQAYSYHKLYSDIKDTLLNEQSSKQIAEMNTKYDSEKKDKELIQKDAEINKQQAETEKQNLQRNAFIIGFSLVLVLAFFIYRGYRQKKTANGLLEEKNILIENQKQLVEEKNLKITESINYAKRIQQAILPSQDLIKSFLPDSFIFFKPKDIVSGDFYWFAEKQDKLIIAVADCTGHGVPGAFMSMIGNTLLNEIVNVKNISESAQILNLLNKGIVSILHQDNNETNTQDDGMDITILVINKMNNEIEFAGANHFSYFINNNKIEILEGDVFSIGGMFGNEHVNFSSQKIKIEKGNSIYLFTDGLIDQFGGEKNTKFLAGRLEQLLMNNQHQDMENQQAKLMTAFDDWQGNNKQLDDVLIMGIKF